MDKRTYNMAEENQKHSTETEMLNSDQSCTKETNKTKDRSYNKKCAENIRKEGQDDRNLPVKKNKEKEKGPLQRIKLNTSA